jgi:hypothetical protein
MTKEKMGAKMVQTECSPFIMMTAPDPLSKMSRMVALEIRVPGS